MRTVGHVVAVAPTRDEVEPIRDDLRAIGVEPLIRAARPGSYPVEDTSMHEHVTSARRGMLLGMLVGAALGAVLVFAIPELRDLGAAVKLLIVAGIALQGSMPAVMWRMGRAEHYDDDPAVTRDVAAGDQLVIVEAEHEEARVRRILERHHATFVTEDRPR